VAFVALVTNGMATDDPTCEERIGSSARQKREIYKEHTRKKEVKLELGESQ
jgi:hypothetical protein